MGCPGTHFLLPGARGSFQEHMAQAAAGRLPTLTPWERIRDVGTLSVLRPPKRSQTCPEGRH